MLPGDQSRGNIHGSFRVFNKDYIFPQIKINKGQSIIFSQIKTYISTRAHTHIHTQTQSPRMLLKSQAPLSMGFPRKEYWTGLLFPSPRGLPKPGIEPRSPALQADILPSELPGKTSEIIAA